MKTTLSGYLLLTTREAMIPDLLRWYGGMGVPGTGDFSLRRVRS